MRYFDFLVKGNGLFAVVMNNICYIFVNVESTSLFCLYILNILPQE